MRTELYSVRSSTEEMSILNKNLRKVVKKLSDKTALRVLYKTEIDYNPRKIKADLIESLSADNPPELYIYINALDTQDDTSFRYLFYPLIERLEKELPQDEVAPDGKTPLYPHIKVYPLTKLKGKYPAYCFIFKNKKVLALARINLVGGELSEYLCNAVNCAKEIFDKAFTECPEGFVYSTQKPMKNTFFSNLFSKKKANTASKVISPKEVASEAVASAAPMEKTPDVNIFPEVAPVEEVFSQNISAKEFSIDEIPSENIPAEEIAVAEIPSEDIPAEEIAVSETSAEDVPAEDKTDKKKPDATANTSASLILQEDMFPAEVLNKKATEQPAESESSHNPDANQTDSAEETADSLSTPKNNKFKAFLSSIFPKKGDTTRAVISKIAVLIAVIGFFTGAYLLLDFYVIKPWQNNSVITEIQDVFYETVPVQTDAQGNTTSTPDEKPAKNWAGLEKINKEIVGWVKIDKTKIDYPVLFHKGDNADSQFYLYKNYKKEYSDFGSIFLDYRCPETVNSKHVILHGHNMGSDDSMFGSLIQYSRYKGWVQGNTKYYKANPLIKFETPELDAEWIIFATMKIEVSNENEAIFNYLLGDFSSDAQFMNFIYNIKERSYLNVDVPINENDRLLTLSTCSYETDNMRTVVVARMVREGEDVSKYVKSVEKATPAKRVYSSFAQEYEAGNIKWYDGQGKLEGDESLEYMEQAEMYVVKFVDANGKTIASQQVIKGKDATEPTGEAPRKASDGTYYYTFKGWSGSFKNVTKDLIIKPVFNKHLMDTPETTARETDPPEPTPQAPVTPVTPAPEPAPTLTTPPTTPPTNPPTQAPTPAVTEAPAPVTSPVTDPVE